jgi:nitrite reductase/ring-hydroxylating ferredoxin subunit
MSDTITKEVLDASELKEGQMKAVDVDGGKVLLSNIGGKINATSAYCTHYGAPLESTSFLLLQVSFSNPQRVFFLTMAE